MGRMLASLIKQILVGVQPLPRFVTEFVEDHKKRNATPDINQLIKLLHRVIRTLISSRDIFLVLDAVERCGESPPSEGSPEPLLDFIYNLAEQVYGNLHFIIASRPDDRVLDMTRALTIPAIRADVAKDTKDDVDAVIDYHLEHGPYLKNASPVTKNLVASRLKQDEQK